MKKFEIVLLVGLILFFIGLPLIYILENFIVFFLGLFAIAFSMVLKLFEGKPKEHVIGEIRPFKELQKEYGLYVDRKPKIRLNPKNVPEKLRILIPYAEKWGIGDDAIRTDFIEKTTAKEKKKFGKALIGKTKSVNEWLDSFGNKAMNKEAEAFMYMLSSAEETGVYPKEQQNN